jgi:hypothetical protein
MRLTTEQVNELRERSKDDKAIIVGSDVRQLCDRIDELEAAGRQLLMVCLPPHDVSGSEMFKQAALKFSVRRP